MSIRTGTRRVLWVEADDALRGVLDPDAHGWEGRPAATCEQARFLQQLDPSDAVILGGTTAGAGVGLSYLGLGPKAPLLYVADIGPESVREALVAGADAWLPRQAVLDCPTLLTAALERLISRHGANGLGGQPTDRRRASRLVSLLWETLPGADLAPWFSQRHILDRLHEEISRCHRHGGVFSLILGELQVGRRTPRPASARRTAWAARLITRSKRRCDVVGQYGPSGFLLLLPTTPVEAAERVRQRLCAQLQRPPEAEGKPWPRFRSGLASYQPEDTAVSLLCRAEKQAEANGLGDGVLA